MSVVIVALVAVMLLLCAGIGTYARVATDTERARLAADQAALAGASVVLGSAAAPGGSACAAAGEAASRNGARLDSCRELSTGVQVETSRASAWGRTAHALARAGSSEAP